jgi:peptidoglycan/LPS O-acetylase OafA/YrhL
MDYLAYVLPYATVFAVGYRWVNADRKFQLTSLCMSLAFFCLFLALHGFQPSESKYPPDYGYIAYGVLVGSVLLLVLPNRRNKYVEYISRNSFNIYLIHILVLFGYNLVRDKVRLGLLSNFVVEYVIVIVFSIVLNYCLLLVWDKMKRSTIHGNQKLPQK